MSLKYWSLNDLDIKVKIGNRIVNILYLSYGENFGNIVKHSHIGCYEVHFIPSGQGTVYINDEKYDITPGSLYITGPNIIHEQISMPSDPMAEFCMCFEFIGKEDATAFNCVADNDLEFICKLLEKTTFWFGYYQNECIKLFNEIISEANNKCIGYYEIIKDCIKHILIMVVRCCTQNLASSSRIPLKTVDDRRLVIIDRYFNFNENFNLDYERLSIHELSKKLGVSIRQTNRILEKYYGKSFREVELQRRIIFASQLLTRTAKSITEIALLLGFPKVNTFNCNFKKFYHISPALYRQIHSSLQNNMIQVTR